jgi:2-polyprenyl-6-methoxyphenol hydroxylase-like FAD-dependent oxidoreductase
MTDHAVVIAGGGPTGLMLAGELALARVDVAIVERRESQDLAGLRALGLTYARSTYSISGESLIVSFRGDS